MPAEGCGVGLGCNARRCCCGIPRSMPGGGSGQDQHHRHRPQPWMPAPPAPAHALWKDCSATSIASSLMPDDERRARPAAALEHVADGAQSEQQQDVLPMTAAEIAAEHGQHEHARNQQARGAAVMKPNHCAHSRSESEHTTLAITRAQIRVQTSGRPSMIMVGPGCTPSMMNTPIRIAMPELPGTPKNKVGSRPPPSLEMAAVLNDPRLRSPPLPELLRRPRCLRHALAQPDPRGEHRRPTRRSSR